MRFTAYLSFNGRCKEAFEFYQQHLRATLQFSMTYGESPMAAQTPAEWRDRIIHATLSLGGSELAGADAPPGYFEEPKGFSVALQVEDAAEAERIFGALAEDGKVTMPLQQTFWAARFGMVVDRFGIPWMINCGQEG